MNERQSESGRLMSRRDFLRTMGVLSGAALGIAIKNKADTAISIFQTVQQSRLDPNFGIEMDGKLDLSFNEAAQLAKRFDRLYDKLPEPEIATGLYGLRQYALELIPQFAYEGITPKSEWPYIVDYIIFDDGDSANHVLGRSDCANYAILNGRMNLTTSTFAKEDIPFTLAHELAHVAQTPKVCSRSTTEEIESSAQIGALEVTSGLALQGNPLWLWATLGELRGMAMSAAYGLALKDDDFEKYHSLRKSLSPGARSEAKFQKARRRWTDKPEQLESLLNKYNTVPLNRIIYAITYKNGEMTDLSFPPIYSKKLFHKSPKPVLLDDTAYLIKFADELVSDSIKGDK